MYVVFVFEMCFWVELRINQEGLVVVVWRVVRQAVVSRNVRNWEAKQIETVRI